jgi:hypothetical protein
MIRIAPDEMALMLDWAKAKLSFPVTTSKFPTGQLKVLSQGWGHCMVNRSIESEHLSIGKRTFKRGLGTHTPSEIIVHLPAPGKTF